MDTPMFIEANTYYAIQMNRGGSSQPYHTSLIRATYPHASNIDQEDIRFCSALSRDPVSCVNQVTSHLQTPASQRWPTSAASSRTNSIREHYTSLGKKPAESYQRDPLRQYAGKLKLRTFQKNHGLLPPRA